MSAGAKLLLSLGLIIVGTMLAASWAGLGILLIAGGAAATWWYLAQTMLRKNWSPLKQKTMQALLGLGAVAVALTPLHIAPRGIFLLALLGAAIGWFAPFLLLRIKK